jgi:hypothetical protein
MTTEEESGDRELTDEGVGEDSTGYSAAVLVWPTTRSCDGWLGTCTEGEGEAATGIDEDAEGVRHRLLTGVNGGEAQSYYGLAMAMVELWWPWHSVVGGRPMVSARTEATTQIDGCTDGVEPVRS